MATLRQQELDPTDNRTAAEGNRTKTEIINFVQMPKLAAVVGVAVEEAIVAAEAAAEEEEAAALEAAVALALPLDLRPVLPPDLHPEARAMPDSP